MSAIDHDKLEAAIRADLASAKPPYLRAAAQAHLRAAYLASREEARQLRAELYDAECFKWRVRPDTHFIPQKDPFEGPGETYRDAYERLSAERERLREALEGALQTWRLTCGNTDMPDAAEFANDFEGDCIPAIEAALSPTFDQRDYGDEMPERPRPRRDGPGLDVKALADLEARN
jgi:hypothetical protein